MKWMSAPEVTAVDRATDGQEQPPAVAPLATHSQGPKQPQKECALSLAQRRKPFSILPPIPKLRVFQRLRTSGGILSHGK